MGLSMKVIGLIINLVARASLHTLTGIFTMALGSMGRQMVLASSIITLEDAMKDTGKMTCNMDLEVKVGLMETGIKVHIKEVKRMDKGNTFGMMEVILKEIGSIIRSQDMEFMYGMIIEDMRGIGFQTKCTEGDFINGVRGEPMKESIRTTINMVSGVIHGQMEGNILENGKTIRGMVEES
jgi:hypothetical protein